MSLAKAWLTHCVRKGGAFTTGAAAPAMYTLHQAAGKKICMLWEMSNKLMFMLKDCEEPTSTWLKDCA